MYAVGIYAFNVNVSLTVNFAVDDRMFLLLEVELW